MARPTILVLIAHYIPGFKYGGPVRTLANIVAHLGGEFDFRIVTSDRDLGDSEPFPNVPVESWEPVGDALVHYLPPSKLTLGGLRAVLRETPYAMLYLNSFFDPRFTIVPLLLRRLRLIPFQPALLAPRGEFAPGALAIKSPKKRLFLWVAKLLGLYRDVIWQASSEHEEGQIRQVMGAGARVHVAADLAPPPGSESAPARSPKQPGRLRALYLGRIAVNKNLLGVLEVLELLTELEGEVTLDIHGPKEDVAYWHRCEAVIERLPPNCRVRYSGVAGPDEVAEVMRTHDLFILPTHGENFGQAIFESLSGGCPVLISDRTPWLDLEEKGVGWDLPLENPTRFAEVIERCVAMDETEHREWSKRANAFALEFSRDDAHPEKSRRMFRETLGT